MPLQYLAHLLASPLPEIKGRRKRAFLRIAMIFPPFATFLCGRSDRVLALSHFKSSLIHPEKADRYSFTCAAGGLIEMVGSLYFNDPAF